MKNQIKIWVALLTIVLSPLLAPKARAVDVVTSLPELGAIANEVGGGNVAVYSIAQLNRSSKPS